MEVFRPPASKNCSAKQAYADFATLSFAVRSRVAPDGRLLPFLVVVLSKRHATWRHVGPVPDGFGTEVARSCCTPVRSLPLNHVTGESLDHPRPLNRPRCDQYTSGSRSTGRGSDEHLGRQRPRKEHTWQPSCVRDSLGDGAQSSLSGQDKQGRPKEFGNERAPGVMRDNRTESRLGGVFPWTSWIDLSSSMWLSVQRHN